MRNDPKHPNHWGLPGGKVESGEALLDAIVRECSEELGSVPDYVKMIPIDQFTSPDEHFIYHTFFCLITDEFQPVLNREHLGYAWLDADVVPRPLHPGLFATINIEAVRAKISVIEQAITSI
jgi:8-oxo-dGTP pyrophosphatase MutT (NUDIX family)